MATTTHPEFLIYKGDTFIAGGLYRVEGTNTPVDLNGITLNAFLKTRDGQELPIDYTQGPGVGEYHLEADTEAWPIGRNLLIIRYTAPGPIVRTAQPVVVNVEDV